MNAASPIRVLIVDDSAVVRRLVGEVLGADPRIEVVGTAVNGERALAEVDRLKPDAMTLDIEMPVMDGITCVRQLRRRHPRLPVVMFSTLTERGASATLDALAAGASDYVTKPSNVANLNQGRQDIADQLIPKLMALTEARARARARTAPPAAPPPPSGTGPSSLVRPSSASPSTAPPSPRPAPGAGRAPVARTSAGGVPGRFGVLAIGSSTGGPDALAQVLGGLPGGLPVPVVIVQHMPPVFTRMLAQRLDATSALEVVEAEEGAPVRPGRVLVAPGGRHLRLRRGAGGVLAHLTDEPPENFCRPAVDVLFRSVVEVYGGQVLAVVLTGMGRDGALGAGAIKQAGGEVLAQDEATSVVWGMPGAVTDAGHADGVLPLDGIAAAVTAAVTGRAADGSRPAGPARPSRGVRP